MPLNIEPQCPRQEGWATDLGNCSLEWDKAGIHPQDRYSNPEGLVSFLKMADEAMLLAAGTR